MHLYLIRHAQSQNNALPEELRVEDPGLTEVGHRQAQCLASWIPALGLTRLFTSPFLRTLQTTEHVRQAVRLTPEVRAELHEQGGCYRGHTLATMEGRPGMTRAEIECQFPAFRVSSEIDGRGWWSSKPYESREQARLRAGRLLQRTMEEFGHTQQRIAFVMHADLKTLLLEQIHTAPLETPHNVSVSTLIVGRSESQLVEYNQVRHLPADLLTR